MEGEKLNAVAVCDASVVRGAGAQEAAEIKGRYEVECRDADGRIKWHEAFDNVVTTEGKNAMLDCALGGATYQTVCYAGIISGASYTTTAAGDTQASHGGWVEAGGANAPAYTHNRPTVTWASAASGAKTWSANAAFSLTSAGTVKGCFVVFGANANNTVGATAGSLLSAGLFTTQKVVSGGDSLSVSYSITL